MFPVKYSGTILLLLAAFILAACGGGGGSSSSSGGGVTVTVTATTPLYSNGTNWNDYVKNDGVTALTATDVACTGAETGGYGACIHGGELRTIDVTGAADCTGVTASDSSGAFNWVCDASTGTVRVVSTGLKDGKRLSDLIDFTTSPPAWKQITVTVDVSGTSATTTAAAWAGNSIVVDNDGMVATETVSGTIYLVTANAGAKYDLDADNAGLVIQPGVVLQGAGSDSQVILVDTQNFVWVEGSVDAAGADQRGVLFTTVMFSVLRGVAVQNSTIHGTELSGSAYNQVSDVVGANNAGDGIKLNNSDGNTVFALRGYNNGIGNSGGGAVLSDSNNNMISNVLAGNNENGFTIANNSRNNTAANVTAANTGATGVFFFNSTNNSIRNSLSSNTGSNGHLMNMSSDNTLLNTAALNNGTAILLSAGANNNKFTGILKVTNASCGLSGAGATPGLDTSCNPTTPSDATLSTGVTSASSFVGKITTDDSASPDDSSGTALFANITDWLSLENAYRAWGKSGAVFPASDNDNACVTSETCQIWEWSLSSSDTALLNVVSVPTGNDVLLHRWLAATTPTSDADCAGIILGSTFNSGATACESTFLQNAVEIIRDGIGNDNTLCESGETCLFTPNIGSYQGHGSLVSAGTFTDGTLTGITLLKYDTNGR